MRLINVKTLELEEFFDKHVPSYAILSHTWHDGEATIGDWQDKRRRVYLPGYQKIERACAEAEKDGLEYLWVDTNCIDKTSSSELSEAVNSMFKYYQRARICYAYLADVPWADLGECKKEGSLFRSSRWFTRGWTLQELIAPPVVLFYSKDWQVLGNKNQFALAIAAATGIGLWCLLGGRASRLNPLRGYSVAQRLAWASQRSTTRIEDRAYSLLGLFDIHIPLVYGEGHEAFRRVLEEIVRKYPDQSILCSQLSYIDFLPRSPKDFCDSKHIVLANSPRLTKYYTPVRHPHHFQMTNLGLQITLPLVSTFSPDLAFAMLDCWDADSEINDKRRYISRIWIPLRRDGPEMYSRLLWPQIFFPVRLPSMRIAMGKKLSKESEDQSSTGGKEAAPSRTVVDLISPDAYKSILIKKPYAAVIDVKKHHLRQNPSPFLICFPRGTADYRLYGIFPQTDDNPLEALQFSLVLNRELPIKTSSDDSTSNEDDSESQNRAYGALLVFKKRKTHPPKFIAICLTNTKYFPTGSSELETRPSCKIIPNWKPGMDNFLDGVGLDTFRGVHEDGSTMVMVQKLPCMSESQAAARGLHPKTVGLTQIVFDLEQMRREIQDSQAAQSGQTGGVLEDFGKEWSDEEVEVAMRE